MAVMKKKDLEALRRDDPKENNWEVEENGDSPVKEQSQGVALKQQYPDELAEIFSLLPEPEMKEKIHAAWLCVSPDIRTNNPVWKYSAKNGKHFIFVFRSGQKVRVEL